MIKAVFISDLHLHPDDTALLNRFKHFMSWIAEHKSPSLYILGDFFHAWAGDDSLDNWSLEIANALKKLSNRGTTIYYMHGNRDFLLGKIFMQKSGMILLPDPTVITLHNQTILLSHGDAYCTLDKSHQRFRRITRNPLFNFLFLTLPLAWRLQLVAKVRQKSQTNRKDIQTMDVVEKICIKQMKIFQTKTLIHGHTHKPGLTEYPMAANEKLSRFVLSDWDDIPQLLCYHQTMGFKFIHING